MSYGNPSVLCFRKFPVTKKFMDKRGGVSRLSVENSLSHSAEKNHREPFCAVIQKISDSEKVYGKEGGRVSRFSFGSFFCLIMLKSFIGKTFCAVFQKISGSEKVYGKERAESIKIFFRKVFLSHNAEKFHRENLLCCVSEFFR